MNYFISRAGQEYGPYTLSDLQRYVASGDILTTDLSRSEGMTGWVPVSQMIGNPISGNVQQPPPRPTAQAPIYFQQPIYVQQQPQAVYVQPAPPPKNRVGYILLGVFLGGLGIHNFYAGYTGRAIAQLLITVLTCGIGAIVSHIWAIVEVCTVDRDSNNVYFS